MDENNTMKKIFLFLILGMFLINLINALDNQGIGAEGTNFTIVQICNDATYITLSSIQYPDRTTIIINENMTSVGGGAFQYNFSDTSQLGRYDVNGISDGCEETFSFYFEITPSGIGGTENIVFIIFIIVGLYSLNLFGFFGKNEILTLLGGMALLFLGVYLIRNGIIIYRDNLTNYFSYITIGWGLVSSFIASYSLYENL